MLGIEQSDRMRIEIANKNCLDMDVVGGEKHGLGLVEHGGFSKVPEEGIGLLQTVMVGHLIAPFFPKIVETNFGMSQTEFIKELYRYYGFRPPKIVRLPDQVDNNFLQNEIYSGQRIELASAHSGGLDSAYRLTKLMAEDKNVLAVHLRNLNNKGNYSEAVASKKQCEVWDIPYEQVRLRNSSGNSGFESMRTRDFLLAIVTAVSAYQYSTEKVLVEGDMVEDPSVSHFSENASAWKMFNKLLLDAKLEMQVEGVDAGDIETVGEVIRLEKELGIEIISLVQNCFSAPYQLPNSRQKWVRETPTIAKNSSEHWCGSCLKCRRMTLGRIYYNDPKFNRVNLNEVNYFVRDTYNWLRKYPNNSDLISISFMNHLEAIAR